MAVAICSDAADSADVEDPFLFFTKAAVVACMGEWTSKQLTLKISDKGGQWILKSGKRELILKETDKEFEWSVYETAAMEKELYLASVSGYGPRTRLTMRPGKQHSGSGKKLVLWRGEHKPEDGEADQKDEAEGVGKQPLPDQKDDAAARRRDESPGLIGDAIDEPRDSSGGDGAKGRRRSGKRERGGARRDKGRKGAGKRNSGSRSRRPRGRGRSDDRDCSSYSRSRSRSRRPRGRGHSPPRRGGGNRGGEQAGGKGDDSGPVTTVFITGLPDDALEGEVRGDLEACGEINKVVVMKRGNDRNAFVRFATVPEATRCVEQLNDGKLRVCGETRIKAEIARRNTN